MTLRSPKTFEAGRAVPEALVPPLNDTYAELLLDGTMGGAQGGRSVGGRPVRPVNVRRSAVPASSARRAGHERANVSLTH